MLAFKGLKLYVSAVGNRSHYNLEGIVPIQVSELDYRHVRKDLLLTCSLSRGRLDDFVLNRGCWIELKYVGISGTAVTHLV
jgi:hypothetical protein